MNVALKQIEGYEPTSVEADVKARMLDFLTSGENQFDRSNLDRHFTGSGIVIDVENDMYLFNHHKFLDMWLCFDVLYVFAANMHDAIEVSDESVSVKWFTYDEAMEVADPRMVRVLEKWNIVKEQLFKEDTVND